MAFLIDTDTIIFALRGDSTVLAKFKWKVLQEDMDLLIAATAISSNSNNFSKSSIRPF